MLEAKAYQGVLAGWIWSSDQFHQPPIFWSWFEGFRNAKSPRGPGRTSVFHVIWLSHSSGWSEKSNSDPKNDLKFVHKLENTNCSLCFKCFPMLSPFVFTVGIGIPKILKAFHSCLGALECCLFPDLVHAVLRKILQISPTSLQRPWAQCGVSYLSCLPARDSPKCLENVCYANWNIMI